MGASATLFSACSTLLTCCTEDDYAWRLTNRQTKSMHDSDLYLSITSAIQFNLYSASLGSAGLILAKAIDRDAELGFYAVQSMVMTDEAQSIEFEVRICGKYWQSNLEGKYAAYFLGRGSHWRDTGWRRKMAYRAK